MLPSRSVRLVAARTTVSRRSGRRKTLGWAGGRRWSQWHAAALLGLVLKHARRLAGFDEAIVSLYAKGLTTADIRAHLAETYGVELSNRQWDRRGRSAVRPPAAAGAIGKRNGAEACPCSGEGVCQVREHVALHRHRAPAPSGQEVRQRCRSHGGDALHAAGPHRPA